MATEAIQAAITPGSVPYGQRENMEDAISASGNTPEATAAPAGALNPINPDDPFSSPMTALLNKGGFTSDRPLTSGLSVGPGTTPAFDTTGLPVDTMRRLQEVALNAKSPQLRGAALLALRRIAQNRR